MAAENPIYVLGDYNASAAHSFNDTTNLCHVPAAVMGDAVTLLSNAWVDSTTFDNPTSRSSRPNTTDNMVQDGDYRREEQLFHKAHL